MCREWEATARQVNQQDVRLVLLRIGVVLGKDGGALGRWVPFISFRLPSLFFSPALVQGSFRFEPHCSPNSSVYLQQRWSLFLWCLPVVLLGRDANGCFSFASIIYAGILVKSISSSRHTGLSVSTFKFDILYLCVCVVLPTISIDLMSYIFTKFVARFSWIHIDDLVNLIYESLINPSYKGDLTSTTAHSLISLFYMNSIAHWINSSSILVIWFAMLEAMHAPYCTMKTALFIGWIAIFI